MRNSRLTDRIIASENGLHQFTETDGTFGLQDTGCDTYNSFALYLLMMRFHKALTCFN